MAQIRSKQIADFLQTVNWGAVTTTDIANASAIKSYVSTEISTEHAHHTTAEATLTSALSTETARAIAAEGALDTKIGVDIAALSTEIAATNTDFTDVNSSIDSLELALSSEISATNSDHVVMNAALSTEISATNSEVTSVNTRATNLESALSSEISATNSEVIRLDGTVTTEASTRLANDNTLQANITAEASIARAAELVLTNALSSEIAATNSDFVVTNAAIVTEKNKIDAILLAADADKDTFVEIVSLINAVDLENDDALASVILDLSSEISSTNSDFVRVEAKLSTEDSIEKARAMAAEGVLTNALSSEIAATNSEVTSVNTRATNLESALSSEISATNSDVTRIDGNVTTEKNRIDAILLASDADKDSFAEIVTLINSVDTTNDTAFAAYVLSNNAALSTEISSTNSDFVVVNASIDSLETALTAEISATNSDHVVMNAALSTEEVARETADTTLQANITSLETAANLAIVQGDTYLEEKVVNLNAVKNSDLTFNTLTNFMTAPYDMELYVNGIRVDFDQLGANQFKLNLLYDIDATDIVKVYGIPVIAAPAAAEPVWYTLNGIMDMGKIDQYNGMPRVLGMEIGTSEPMAVSVGDLVTVEKLDGTEFSFIVGEIAANNAGLINLLGSLEDGLYSGTANTTTKGVRFYISTL